MSNSIKLFVTGAVLTALFGTLSADAATETYGSYVDEKGAISLPGDFRTAWVHVGAAMLTAPLPAGSGLDRFAPGRGFHDVYTQPVSFQAYKKTGTWPDGAALVMEIRGVLWDDLPTGHVMLQGPPEMWLVMIRDRKARFPGNPQWGDGWGWAFFRPQDTSKNLSKDYGKDCSGCHESVKETDRVFIQAYPELR